MIRTDLAMEAKSLWEKSARKTTELPGVRAWEEGNLTWVDILDREGAEALGKPVGTYVTMELPPYERDMRGRAEDLGQILGKLCKIEPKDSVLIVGLGNRGVTPDALGPQTVDGLFITRHLIHGLPKTFGSCRSVSALIPGVLATTGVESLELVRGALAHVEPKCVICVDALAAGSMERLCNTVQCCDAGIAPGSGVGNCRAAFSRESLGVPVYAIGVPTVVDGGQGKGMILTPRDIDARIRYLSGVISGGLNLFLHRDFSYEDFHQFVPV